MCAEMRYLRRCDLTRWDGRIDKKVWRRCSTDVREGGKESEVVEEVKQSPLRRLDHIR